MSKKLIFILEQVVSGRVPLHMSQRGVSAPLVQIRILDILEDCFAASSLCDIKSSLSDVLFKIFQRCDVRLFYVHFIRCLELY